MEFRRVLFRSSGGRGKGHGVHPYSCSGSMLVDLGRAIRSAAVVDLSRLAARSGETRATCGMFWVSTAGWATDQGRRRVEVIWLRPVAARSQSISTTVTVWCLDARSMWVGRDVWARRAMMSVRLL